MTRKSPTRLRTTKAQRNMPDFVLPPLKLSPSVIKLGLFKWELMPYVEDEERQIKTTCTECSKEYLSAWPIQTSNLKSHYQHNHRHLVHYLSQKAYESGLPREETFLAINIVPSESSTPSLNSSFENIGLPSKRAKHAFFDKTTWNRLVLNVIIDNNLPFSFVDSPAVKKMLTYLKPDMPNMSRSSIRSGLDVMYEKELQRFKRMLSEVSGRFALTLDEWKASNNADFLGVTLHYYDNDFELKNYTIGFEHLNNNASYTGDVLCNSLMNVLAENDIQDRIVSITRDNAGPMNHLLDLFTSKYNSATNGLEFDGDTRCAGHVLNLCMEEFLKCTLFSSGGSKRLNESLREIEENNPEMKDVFESMKYLPRTVRSIVHGINYHQYLRNTFKELTSARKLREGLNLGPEILVKGNNTRWLSTFKMVDRFIYFREEITTLLKQANRLSNKKRKTLMLEAYEITDADWAHLQTIRDILQIFKEPILELESSSVSTIGFTIPYVHALLQKLKDLETQDSSRTNPFVALGLQKAREKLLAYYPIESENIDSIQNLYLATVLDPRFKLGLLKDLGFSHSIISSVESYFIEIYEQYKWEYKGTGNASANTISQGNGRGVTSQRNDEPTFRENFFLSSECGEESNDEVRAYLQEKRELQDVSIGAFYRSRQSAFPIIYRMAKDFLATPAMSAPSESLFSRINDVLTKNQNRLLPLTIRVLAILNSRGIILDESQFVFEEDPALAADNQTQSEDVTEDETFIVGDDDGGVIGYFPP